MWKRKKDKEKELRDVTIDMIIKNLEQTKRDIDITIEVLKRVKKENDTSFINEIIRLVKKYDTLFCDTKVIYSKDLLTPVSDYEPNKEYIW